jgi:hypothetical protein
MFYWRTTFTIDSTERGRLDELGISTLYVRYLDVEGWGFESLVPQQPIQTEGELRIRGLSIVPTVYIVPAALRNDYDSSRLRAFAKKLVRYMMEVDTAIHQAAGTSPRSHFERVLLDYDWTPSTREVFFRLLRSVQELLPATSVESTIRLWQYHNPLLAGIPPVKRGILMCYNMEPYDDPWTTNAVASIERFKQFVTTNAAEAYPVLLDIAYPIFRQSVHLPVGGDAWYSRRIIHTGLSIGRHVFPSDTMIDNEQIGSLDVIRVDGGTTDVLNAMREHAARTIPNDRMVGTTLFAFDTVEINRIGVSTLNSILSER